SHDLKTPLTVILANSSILLDNADETIAKNSQWVESTKTEAEHMKQLVDDLLTMAQIDEGDTTMPREDIDFSTMVQGEFLEFESVAFERNVEFASTISPDIHVTGTPSRVRRLAQTLIDNACKYAPAGSTVTLTLDREGSMARLSVHNDGDPIPAEDLPHIFDRFYRVDKARVNDGDSHGLGLAIAYGIAQEHGGSLEVSSTAETGTTFTATLPL
ncbi:MAG: HAMP domain-containing sensor histidine kinase, partial [Eggerthellaceae bacterium]|nr:HAMP domain-containing sensor histidine kinase [Eggerthellaceae bacterium]MDO5118137.1 HAMP domain-containing sensor histidine kinase [Eggerthellaceae bacterium]